MVKGNQRTDKHKITKIQQLYNKVIQYSHIQRKKKVEVNAANYPSLTYQMSKNGRVVVVDLKRIIKFFIMRLKNY